MLSSLTWVEALPQLKQQNKPWVMATVIGTRGSSPRDSGSKMLITDTHIFDTIGGGQLEYKVIEQARALISEPAQTQDNQILANFPLAAKTNQCCGGHVSVLLEYFAQEKASVHVFGAGHVAHALIPILNQMDIDLHWIDNRADLFPSTDAFNDPSFDKSASFHHYDNPIEHIGHMPENTYALVLTHDHRLDYELITALLDKQDCQFIGLIGSETKALRFKARLKSDSFSQQEIDSVICPVGLQSIPGKKPIEIAISISAQLAQLLNNENESRSLAKKTRAKSRTGLNWKSMNEAIQQSGQHISDKTDKKEQVTHES